MLLQRITTEFVEVEDRIRLAGRDQEGRIVTLWLTQRLLKRLLPLLCQWLEKQDTGGGGVSDPAKSEAMQDFAQQEAGVSQEPSPPVPADPASAAMDALVHEVDISRGDQRVRLLFKSPRGDAPEQAPELIMDARQLHQWLGIVYRHYRVAGWPRSPWPRWMRDSEQQSADPALLH